MRLWGKGEKSDPHLLEAQQALDTLFDATNKERKETYRLQQVLGNRFPVFTTKKQWPMNGQKETSCGYLSTAGTCLSEVYIGETLHAKSSTASSPRQLFPGKYSEA